MHCSSTGLFHQQNYSAGVWSRFGSKGSPWLLFVKTVRSLDVIRSDQNEVYAKDVEILCWWSVSSKWKVCNTVLTICHFPVESVWRCVDDLSLPSEKCVMLCWWSVSSQWKVCDAVLMICLFPVESMWCCVDDLSLPSGKCVMLCWSVTSQWKVCNAVL